jgi:class 3 adenylate cyclase
MINLTRHLYRRTDAQADHALIMAGFALQCRLKMKEVTRKLERTLGPDTGYARFAVINRRLALSTYVSLIRLFAQRSSDLVMRFGIHSGPVIAGVLRGERSRFQLFGDTVNTAARMESTGERNRIQVSETTAQLLSAAGKENWISPRNELVAAKGKVS